VSPDQYIGAFVAIFVIIVFTWQGLNLVKDPTEWLVRHGRPTTDKHIRASRIIGWMFLAAVLLTLSQLIGSLLRFRL
jgi:hypothetical protein